MAGRGCSLAQRARRTSRSLSVEQVWYFAISVASHGLTGSSSSELDSSLTEYVDDPRSDSDLDMANEKGAIQYERS